MALLPKRSLKCQLRCRSRQKGLVASLTMAVKTVAQIRTVDRALKMEILQDLLGPFSDDCFSALHIKTLSCVRDSLRNMMVMPSLAIQLG